MSHFSRCVLAGMLLIGLLSGCGSSTDEWTDKRPEVAPVEGVVQFDGQPLEGATVVFSPTSGTHAASDVTDDAGRFELSAFPPEPGAVPGQYRVTITKQVEDPAARDMADNEHGPSVSMKSVIPEKYADAAQSGLTADVPPGGKDDFSFILAK